MTTKIDDLTIGEARELASMFSNKAPNLTQSHSWKIGAYYAIRTVTMAYTGKLISVTDTDIVLDEAAWIADTGRFAQFVESPAQTANEVEPFPRPVIVFRGGLIDAVEVPDVPRSQR